MAPVRSNSAALALVALALLAGTLTLAPYWAEPLPQVAVDSTGIADPTVDVGHAGPLPVQPVHAVDAPAGVQPVPGLRVSEAVDWPSIVRMPLQALALTLESSATSRSAWELEVRAVAGSLGADASKSLLGAAGDSSRGLSERVAAAELLRVLELPADSAAFVGSDRLRCGDEALQALRVAGSTVQPFPLRCAAACRALAALGTPGDIDGLLQSLSSPADTARRDMAMWGLQAARSETAALQLVEFACSGSDPSVGEAAVIALDGYLRSRERGELSADVREQLARSVAARVVDADSPSILRLRALPLLCGLGGETARTALQDVLRDPNTSAGLANAAANALCDGGRARPLMDPAQLLADSAALRAHPLEMAEAIVRATGPDGLDPRLRIRARAVLRDLVEQPGCETERKRVILALSKLDEAPDQN